MPFDATPIDAHLLNGLLFVNRRVLRASLRSICVGNGKQVLMVEGPPGTGKSYSVELIRHIAQANRDHIALAYVDLKEEQHAMFQPEMLARRIMRQMGRNAAIASIPRLDGGSEPFWLRELCDWLVGEAEDSGKTWIVVLDGFNNGDLPKNTQDLVVEMITRSVGSSLLRTVLLSYSPRQRQIMQQDKRIDYEELKPLSREDLQQFMEAHARASNPQAVPTDIERVVDSIWNEVTSTGPDRTALLAKRIERWVQP